MPYPATSAHARIAILQDRRRHGVLTHEEAEELAMLDDIAIRLEHHRDATRRQQVLAQRLREEHRAALDAVNAELHAVRTQAEELAVLYGKARLDADKLAQLVRAARDERDEARQALADAVKAGNALSDSLGREAAEMRRDRDELRDAMAKSGDLLAACQDERDAALATLETLKDTATLRDAVRALVDTENSRRRFSNERRKESGIDRPPMRLVPRP